jgi:hypothetical protein
VSKSEFGFVCGNFSVALTGNQVVVPGSNGTLKKSLLPALNLNDAAGLYTMEMSTGGKVVCDMPVNVVWCRHEKEPEPFLGFKADDPEEMRSALAAFTGQRVSLKFTPRNK